MSQSVYYIVVAMMLASATLSLIFFVAWKTLGERPYALTWSIGFLAAAFQWFFNLQSHWFPSFESYWLTVNLLALVLITLGLRGHCQRTNNDYVPKNLWPFTAAIYIAIVWATAISPHVGLRTAMVPAIACLTLLLSAWIVFRFRQKPRPAEWAVVVSMGLFAITQGIAAVMAMKQGVSGDSAYQLLYMNYNFLTLPAGYIAMGMSVILMLASDISIDMKEIAIHDQLTDVLNRRGLGEEGAKIYAAARRTSQPVSVVMSDIDRFKRINDEHGHAFGDAALVHFSKLLKEERRLNDVLARVGGEEFALILPGTDVEGSIKIADKLREKIETNEMIVEGTEISMTASFGVATISVHDTCLSDIIVRADRALYRSKRAGRNQVDLESSQLMLAADGTLKPVTK